MRSGGPAALARFAAALFAALLCISCREQVGYTTYEYVYPLEREVEEINRAAWPSRSYTVRPGDTLSGIAASEGVNRAVLAQTNGLDEDDILKPGDVLVIPIARSGGVVFTGPGAAVAAEAPAPAPPADAPLVGPGGDLRAVSAGRVIGVFRKYTSLGDVVIIENERRRIVYSGDFEPAVVKGAEVRAGGVIGRGASVGGVNARFFEKR